MWMHRSTENIQATPRIRRVSQFIDRNFQIRYSSLVVAASTLGMLIAVLPIYYFLSQNYSIFNDIAFQFAPTLLDHLEREQIWVSTLLFAGFVGLTLFFILLSFRMTNRIVGPLKVVRNHLRRLSRGHWYIHPVKVRETDEFHDLIDSYNYFYNSMRTQIRRDLDLLKKMKIDPNDREGHSAWSTMMAEKSMQLNAKADLPPVQLNAWIDEASAVSPDSRHAS